MDALNAQILAAFLTSLCKINVRPIGDDCAVANLLCGHSTLNINLYGDRVYISGVNEHGMVTYRQTVTHDDHCLANTRDAVNAACEAAQVDFFGSMRKTSKDLSYLVQWCRELYSQARKNGDQDAMDFIALCGRIYKENRYINRDMYRDLQKLAQHLVRSARISA